MTASIAAFSIRARASGSSLKPSFVGRAQDAHRAGFTVFVIEEACRGIDVDGSVAASRHNLAALDIPCISAQVLA
jgi:hypothetical protein